MFQIRTSTESGPATAAAFLPVGEVGRRLVAERAIDDVLQDSFPASDPPSWNPGVVRPRPSRQPAAPARTVDAHVRVGANDIVDVSRPHAQRTFLDTLISSAGAAAVGLLFPLAILAIGFPFVLVVRGLLEAIAWAFGVSILERV